MSDILKEPAFYRTLGALAQALGKPGSFGYGAGQYGQQASEEWAARKAQEQAEKEQKKKKQAGIAGDIGGVAGGLALAPFTGGMSIPAAAALTGAGAAVGNAAGQGLGGGSFDYIDPMKSLISGGTTALTAGALGAITGGAEAAASQPAASGIVPITGEVAPTMAQAQAAGLPSLEGLYTGVGKVATTSGQLASQSALPLAAAGGALGGATPLGTYPASAQAAKQGAPASAKPYDANPPVKTLESSYSNPVPLTQPTQKSGWRESMGNFIDTQYGGPAGLATYLAESPQRNAAPLSESLHMYPGQTEQSFLAQKQSARADDALQAQKQATAATQSYRAAQAAAAAQRAQLDQQKFEHQKKVDSKPGFYDRTNAQGGQERVQYDVFTGQEQSAAPLAPPKMDIRQESGGYRAVNPYTQQGQVVEAPLPQPPQQPKFGIVKSGNNVLQYNIPAGGGAGSVAPLYIAPPDTSKAPPHRTINTEQGVQDQDYVNNQWVNTPGSTPKGTKTSITQSETNIAEQTDLLRGQFTNLRNLWGKAVGNIPPEAERAIGQASIMMQQAFADTGLIGTLVRDATDNPQLDRLLYVLSDGSTVAEINGEPILIPKPVKPLTIEEQRAANQAAGATP